VVISGPSGAGKDAVMRRLRERGFPVAIPATMTTRAPREGEVDGVHHVFVTPDEFLRNVAAGELLEHAEVYGNLYGVPRSQVRKALATGNDVLIRVDVQGAESLRAALPDALSLFIAPESRERLAARLNGRGTESEGERERRLAAADRELEEARHFSHMVTNVEGNLDATVDAVWALLEAERARPGRVPVVV
jgi:guanylate kinase